MNNRTYYMVLFEEGKSKGDSFCKKSFITEDAANKIMSTSGNPTIKRKEDDVKYKVTEKRLFEWSKSDDGDKILFLILDVIKLSK